MRVLVTRDRQSAGGGIAAFFNAVQKYFTVKVRYVDIGRPFSAYYGGKKEGMSKFTVLRLIGDYLNFIFQLVVFWPDIVHLNTSLDKERKSIRRDAVKVVISKLFFRKVLVFWHGWYWKGAPDFPDGGKRGLICKMYKLADAYVVLTDSFKKDLERWGFSGHIFTGSVAFDTGLVFSRKEAAGNRTATILFLSSVLKEKGIIELVEAYRSLREKGLSCELVIAGDGPYLEQVKTYVSRHEVPGVVFTGFVAGDRKAEVYSNASVFCLPSYDEAMPVVVIEAMAAGLPVVATKIGALADMLEDGKTGFFVSLTAETKDGLRVNTEELSCKIEMLVKDAALAEKISLYNLNYAVSRFHPQVVAKSIEKIYYRMT